MHGMVNCLLCMHAILQKRRSAICGERIYICVFVMCSTYMSADMWLNKWVWFVNVDLSISPWVPTQAGVRGACVSHMHSKYVALGNVGVHYCVCVCECVWRGGGVQPFRMSGAVSGHQSAKKRQAEQIISRDGEGTGRRGKGRTGKSRGEKGSAGTKRREVLRLHYVSI